MKWWLTWRLPSFQVAGDLLGGLVTFQGGCCSMLAVWLWSMRGSKPAEGFMVERRVFLLYGVYSLRHPLVLVLTSKAEDLPFRRRKCGPLLIQICFSLCG